MSPALRRSANSWLAILATCHLVPAVSASDPVKTKATDVLAADDAPPPAGSIRFQWAIVRVPLDILAKALIECAEGPPGFWENWLMAWESDGMAPVVIPEGAGREELTPEKPQIRLSARPPARLPDPYRYLQSEALVREALSRGEARPARYRQETFEHWFSPPCEIEASWAPSPPGAGEAAPVIDATFKLTHEPAPLAGRDRVFDPAGTMKVARPEIPAWSVSGSGRWTAGRVVFLGAQVEAPTDGGIRPHHVLAGFGRFSGRTTASKAESNEKTGELQIWTLALPESDSVPAVQTPAAQDAWARERLKALDPGGSLKLVGVSSLPLAKGRPSAGTARLSWEDGIGFEPFPAGDGTFLIAPCERADYGMEFRTDARIEHRPDKAAGSPWLVRLNAGAPTQPTRWIFLRTALEQADDDPRGIELGESQLAGNHAGEGFHSALALRPGRYAIAASILVGNERHVTVVRLLTADPMPIDLESAEKPAPLPRTTLSIVETPLSWLTEVLDLTPATAAATAEKVLAAVSSGGATRLAELSASGSARSTAVRLHDVDEDIYLHPLASSTPFHPRAAGILEVGHRWSRGTSPDRLNAIEIASAAEPAARRWAIWRADLPASSQEHSWIRRPIQPISTLKAVWPVLDATPRVLAVIRTSDPAAPHRAEPRWLWYVGHTEASPVASRPESGLPQPRSWQMLIVRSSGNTPSPENLLAEVKSGRLAVQDCLTAVQTGATDGFTGSDFHEIADDGIAQSRRVGTRISFDGQTAWTVGLDAPPRFTVQGLTVPAAHAAKTIRFLQDRAHFSTTNLTFDHPLPPPGQMSVHRLSDDTLALLRGL